MTTKDLGLAAVNRSFTEMAVDDEWSVRGERGFTWWGAWVRQHVWSDDAVRSRGETLWHVRARTAAYRNQPDGPATYAFVNELNAMPGTSAYVFDPDDGTISARSGVFTYDGVDGWLERFFRVSVALQASIAWLQVPAEAAGRALDDEPHPTSGPRKDPDDMLNFAGAFPGTPSPLTTVALRDAAGTLADEGLTIAFDEDAGVLQAVLPVSADAAMGWAVSSVPHPLLGDGALVRLFVPWRDGRARLAWIANALNLAESASWTGEDRPHALGAWTVGEEFLVHTAFFPAVLVGGPDDDDALIAIRNFLAWGGVRARFAADRLPWLAAAARSRYPNDDPPEADDDGDTAEDEAADPDGEPDAHVPVGERSFGPASRTPRPRTAQAKHGVVRELVVDPLDPAAFHEIDNAVAEAEDGDRIVVRPGTYRTPVVVDRAVTIVGDGPIAAIRLEPAGGEALGIAASGATIEGLTIRPAEASNDRGSWSAVAVHDAVVTVEGCDLSTHLGATVWVGGPASRAVLLGCTISGGSQNAVWVVEEGRAELAACVVAGNRWPIVARGRHAAISIESCEITENLDGGIAASEGATLVIEGSTIARNGGFGALLDGAAPASRVEDCTIEGNAAMGVGIGGCRGVRILRNRIRRNDMGITILGGAAPSIEGNELAGNRIGMGVRGENTDPVVLSNTVAGGAEEGVIVDEGAAGRFEGNRVSGSGGVGVWVDNAGTSPTFSENSISACKAAGILVSNGAGGEYRSNDLRGNAEGSWAFHKPGELTRAGNLEDAGVPRGAAADPDGPAPGPRLVN